MRSTCFHASNRRLFFNSCLLPGGDLKFTMGRFSMNANDYARDWYSCDEVSGDFQLKHFNINRDKTTLIPFIKAAQQYNPDMTFWMSPWSPPFLDENQSLLFSSQ